MLFYTVEMAQARYVVKSEAQRWPENCILENLPQIFRCACIKIFPMRTEI